MASPKEWPRLSFQEALELIKLPDKTNASQTVKRFMSRQPAWVPGQDLPEECLGLIGPKSTRGSYGGVVYAQASLAAARIVEQEDREQGNDLNGNGRGIHSINAIFTSPGRSDRPFIFDVSHVLSSRSFSTRLVSVRQSTQPSSNPPGPFPISDAEAILGNTCLACLVTFKRPVPSRDEVQGIPPQQRYKDILSTKAPADWGPCPQLDIDAIKQVFSDTDHGTFPILDMHQVDMTAYNADKPIPDRRELIYYRLLKPIPKEDVNVHILCHAFQADRNGLLILGNYLGYGHDMGKVASLSYSFYVHVNAKEAVMEGDSWWMHEVCWSRYSAGRGTMKSSIWSPQGKHVATGLQDGIVMPMTTKPGREAKM
ncbi:hypothetical protein FZEAL_5590 [Fusarium zealandicum]|uniref:Acyl-CoA thioesterase-like N-terminal HotDog domain-containing protein n=1 Tax=Fusarium zealandicum TaxID=1053134 RepID=A0A8H4XKC1_9HYPO|nr:hypothetical protein FZEAL_5590 [Fusarium zealandicum]